MVTEKPSLETVWKWLSAVPDPEIPVISLTDLGIIRDVDWQEDTLVVTVTPCAGNCFAFAVPTNININISMAVNDNSFFFMG